MNSFVKHYIGKGKQVEGLQIVKVTLKVEDLLKFKHQYDGTEFVSFEVAKLKETDKFGHDYTVYVNKIEKTTENKVEYSGKKAPQKGKPTKTRSKKSEKKEEFPF
jgi:hypothetical protein